MMKGGLVYDKGAFKRIADSLSRKIENLEKLIEFEFAYVVGNKITANAKSYSTFKDQTGNLRSSMGFILAKNGKIIEEGGFAIVNGPMGNEGKGIKEGKQYAEKLARSSGKGYVLIVVAGMNYAGYVEAKGYDVLTRSGAFMESEVKKMISRILKKAGFK